MNKRLFVSFAVAALLGLVATQAAPPAPPAEPVTPPVEPVTPPVEPVTPPSPVTPDPPKEKTEEEIRKEKQTAFETRNAALKATEKVDTEKILQCNQFVDYAYFNFNSLRGPFIKQVVIDGVTRDVEIRFCVPADQSAE